MVLGGGKCRNRETSGEGAGYCKGHNEAHERLSFMISISELIKIDSHLNERWTAR